MKVLNLYAGIGGNRKLWQDVEVTAVELNPEIASIYQSYFPNDKVIVGDAHQYLLDHYKEFDFIWDSIPCPSHSNARFWSSKGGMYNPIYPDLRLYQEILFLSKFYDGKYCVENVIPYYEPLIKRHKIGRHLFWCNFNIGNHTSDSNYIFSGDDKNRVKDMLGFDIDNVKLLRNCVHPETGLYILNCARNIITKSNVNQLDIFEWNKAIN